MKKLNVRYAVYFAPARSSPWWQLGVHWLGRDEHDDAPLAHLPVPGLDVQALADITRHPRRYGFHATLKAPFRLAAPNDEQYLVARLEALARTLKPARLAPMRVASLGDFVALVPFEQNPDIDTIAAACVVGLDDLRAPQTPADIARRNPDRLDTREAQLLERYGYPHVLERFRFHMTLTDPVDPEIAHSVMTGLAANLDHLNATAPLTLDRLCLFVEREPGANFLRLLDIGLQA